MATTSDAAAQSIMSSVRKTPMQSGIDHNYISCLECRFKGTWQVDAAGHYTAGGDDAELRILRADGVKKYLVFKKDARVSLSSSNVIGYEQADVEEDVDIEKKSTGYP
ncbi:MAG: hypothetical protein ACRECH_16075 [Nitrososphaerales archaeon]